MAHPASSRFELAAFQPEHLDQVVEIERAAFGPIWSRSQFVEESRAALSEFVVLLEILPDRRAVAGYVVWRQVLDEQQIFNLAVRADLRRRGFARRLLDEALARAAAAGASVATLEVHWQNTAAVALYRSHGFAEVGRRKDYYGHGGDALLMERKLESAGVLPR